MKKNLYRSGQCNPSCERFLSVAPSLWEIDILLHIMKNILALCLTFFSLVSFAQITDYELNLTPITINELSGLQSYSFAQHNGEWLVAGGRLDGLHKRQPFASFDAAGNNEELWVINPKTKTVWKANLTSLSTSIQEQLASTNHNFYQDGDQLIITGGYGYSATANQHVTYDGLIAINVSNTIAAIKANSSFSSYIHQLNDTLFDVTGGHLDKIDGTFYLVCGQKFEGKYNPMGPDHGPGFSQEYTHQIRKFNVSHNPLSFTHQGVITDTVNLHRRDYNLVPQIMPNGDEGLTAFSGVFQKLLDLPYLNCVNITSNGAVVNNNFTQYYNHYHSAFLPIYDNSNNEMHSFFFGGIARYYDVGGVLTQDDDVPFVKTIARVSRTSNGTMTEYKLATEMPNYLGAGSEFIVNPNLSSYSNGVLKWDSIQADSIFLGYIYGGIESTAPNVFFSNQTNVSSASSTIYEVSFKKKASNSAETLIKNQSSLQFQVYPNPSQNRINLQFYLKEKSSVTVEILSSEGKLIQQHSFLNLPTQINTLPLDVADLKAGVYLITLRTNTEEITHRFLLN